jgi:uncharacterized protein YndB with AHSA1/START domain
VKLVVQELTIGAPPHVVYGMVTDPEQFVRWMAEDAELDPRPGGIVRWTHANGDTVAGEYVELVPGRRPANRLRPPCSSWHRTSTRLSAVGGNPVTLRGKVAAWGLTGTRSGIGDSPPG